MSAMLFAGALAPGALVAAPADETPSSSSATYRVVNMGTGLGGTVGAGVSINDFGFISGDALLPGSATTLHATIWVYGFPFDLGTLGGTSSTQTFAGEINNRGEVIGISETGDIDPNAESFACGAFFDARQLGRTCVGFVWRNGAMTALPTLGGPNGFAAGLNNLGQVVGWAENTVHDPTCSGGGAGGQVLQFKAVMWGPDGQAHQLPGYQHDPDQAAVAINDRGQIVGVSGICGNGVGALSATHAVMWDHGTVTSLGSLNGQGWDTPMSINNHGDVAGFTNTAKDVGTLTFHAFLWTPETGKMKDLKTLPGDAISEAESINDQGQVVGVSYGTAGFGNPHAFLYQNGVMQNLQSLIPADSGLVLTNGAAINNLGWITATANDAAGHQVTVLLVPAG